jgi:hypothetical protein
VVLGALVVVAVAIPLAALAASGRALPGLPRFEYDGLGGDADGYYAAARQFISKVAGLRSPGGAAVVLALACVVAGLAVAVRRGRLAAHWGLAGGFLALGAAIAFVVTRMSPPGAAVFGWPLVWSIPLLPLRAVGALHERPAFAVSVALSLAAVAGTVVCTSVIGRAATGRRWVGLGAAALYAFWPLLTRPIAGRQAWDNGSWNVLVGLSAYSEPVSTFLVALAIALLLGAAPTPLRLTTAGIALSLATLVKVSNGLIAAAVVLVCLRSLGWRRSLPLVAGGLVFLPTLIAYWPRGYPEIRGPTAEKPAFVSSLGAAGDVWRDSLVFSPRMLAVLVPVAIIGVLAVRSRFALGLLVLPVLVNAAFYTTYAHTAGHPRFLYVSLPAVLVLWAAGAIGVASRVAGWLRPVRSSQSPALAGSRRAGRR